MARVLVLQHHPAETLGIYEQVLQQFAVDYDIVHGYDGEQVPSRMRGYDGLVVMGGPAGVYEQTRLPYLADELRLIDRAIKGQTPVFGVCLGSQLLAAALGAQVQRAEVGAEVGWHEVTLTQLSAADRVWSDAPVADRSFTAFHWHGDSFDLPEGAIALAGSKMTPIQAFGYGPSTYGTLFHMEIDERQIQEMGQLFAADVDATGQDAETILGAAKQHLVPLQAVGRHVFGNWLTLVLEAA